MVGDAVASAASQLAHEKERIQPHKENADSNLLMNWAQHAVETVIGYILIDFHRAARTYA
ncbi:hypothetical protein [Burkholderia ubonensis]|nr:hypothetical protein [Burkholderia ubonensis]KVK78164.1 hypothetical protein WJ44_15355 [Burkholderia ubonensis]